VSCSINITETVVQGVNHVIHLYKVWTVLYSCMRCEPCCTGCEPCCTMCELCCTVVQGVDQVVQCVNRVVQLYKVW